MKNKEGSSVIILNVRKFDVGNGITLPRQRDITSEYEADGPLKHSYTIIKKERSDKNFCYYSVEQYTPTIKEPIRFLLGGVQDYSYGYQRLAKFQIYFRNKDAKLFIFTNNAHTELFLHRLKELINSNAVVIENIEFEFSKIRSIPEIKNIWGVWERVNLAHKSVNASFGVDVDKNPEVKLANATALNIRLETGGKMYTITLSKNGRISTKNIMQHEELIQMFDKFFLNKLK